jgi:predicted permease
MAGRFRASLVRLAAIFRRDRLDRDLAAELESHLAHHVDDNLRAGMTLREARRRALVKLGGVSQIAEQYRERRGIPLLEHLAHDVRFGVRSLRTRPGSTAAAILTLGLGLGANAAVFGVLNAILFQPLPLVHEPDRIVMLNRAGSATATHSYPDYRDVRDRTTALSGVAAYRFAPMNLGGSGTPARIWGYLATGNYFDVLGVRAMLGRAFTPNDDRVPGAHRLVVLSYGCWQRRFGGNPAIVDRTVILNGRSYTVTGVMPVSFRGTELLFSPEVWVPMMMEEEIEAGNNWLERRQTHNIFVFGRLAPGFDRGQVGGALNAVAAQLGREYPDLNEGIRIELSPPGLVGSMLRGPVIGFAAALLVVAVVVLLLACINVIGILLARVTDTQLDRAIRLALGARRSDLVRRGLVETALLCGCGGAAALLLTHWLRGVLAQWHPPIDYPITADLSLDYRVVVFAIILVVFSTLIVGVTPALHAGRTDLLPALKREEAGPRPGWHARDLVVAAQIALSLVLLVGSLLIVRSLQHAAAVDLGFNPRGAVSLRVDIGLQGYDGERGRGFQNRVLERLGNVPGLDSFGLASSLPLTLDISNHRVYVEGQPEPRAPEVPSAIYYQISPGFLRAMQTRIVAGRDFDKNDTSTSRRVALVNQAFVAQILGAGDPIGRRFRTGRSGTWVEIVGVVQDGKYGSLSEEPKPVAYHATAQWYNPSTAIVVRTSLDETVALDSLKRALRDLDPELALFEDGSLSRLLALPLFPMRVAAGALSVFGVLAIVLVTVGIYGLVSYSIAQRTREICIRLAVGASPAHIVRLVVRRTAAVWVAGVSVGAIVAFVGAPVLGPILVDISPRHPGVLILAAAIVALVTIAASWLPTRRALVSNPAALLRSS